MKDLMNEIEDVKHELFVIVRKAYLACLYQLAVVAFALYIDAPVWVQAFAICGFMFGLFVAERMNRNYIEVIVMEELMKETSND